MGLIALNGESMEFIGDLYIYMGFNVDLMEMNGDSIELKLDLLIWDLLGVGINHQIESDGILAYVFCCFLKIHYHTIGYSLFSNSPINFDYTGVNVYICKF